MGTATNKRIVLRFINEVQTGKNLDLVDELFSPDLTMHGANEENLDPRDYMKSALQKFFDAFPDLHVEVLNQVAEGDLVATHKMFRGTHLGDFMGVQPTGRVVEFDVMEFLILRGGTITDHWGMPRIPMLMKQIQD